MSAAADGSPAAASRPALGTESMPLPRATIANLAALSDGGMSDLRELALRVVSAGLHACDAGRATEQAVALTDDGIAIAGREYRLVSGARVFVVGSGKATLAVAAALERRLGDRIDAGAVVVRRGEDTIKLERIAVLVADHPLPSELSVSAAARLVEIADHAGADDLVIASFTGGSSALTSLPPDGVNPAEKRRLHELLLGSGAPITDVNAVRKHVSAIKGGRLARRIAPATVVNLTVSDVAGDVLDAITDPTVEDTSTVLDAIAILRDRGLWDEVPATIRAHLADRGARSPRLDEEPQTVLLVTGASACEAMALEASAAGAEVEVISTELEGEAVELGRALARNTETPGATTAGRPRVLVGCGGEATVSLGPGTSFGKGGPNQEAALALALAIPSRARVCACLLDTDGADGGTAAAGAVVDGLTVERALEAEIDLQAAIAEHRSGDALAALGDQVLTGPTHTNVNDLFAVALNGPTGGPG